MRGGRGAEVNGLLPGRGPPGRGPGEAPGIAAGLAALSVGVVSTLAASVGAAEGACCTGADSVSDSCASTTVSIGAAGFLAAAFLTGAGALAAASFNSGNLVCKRRITGASTVEEADLTYSPTSSSLEIISLLSTPSAFASS